MVARVGHALLKVRSDFGSLYIILGLRGSRFEWVLSGQKARV